MDEAELLKLAEKEILSEAKKAAIRYSVAGPSGWTPCPLQKTNKTFLVNTLLQTVSSNKIRERKKDEPKPKFRERKLLQERNKPGIHNHNIIFNRNPSRNKSKPRPEIKEKTKIIKDIKIPAVDSDKGKPLRKDYSKAFTDGQD